MKVEAIIVCKDYSDFLEHSLAENIGQLDDVIVVTSHDDKKTQAVCNRLGVHFVCTDVFTERGHDFNKGAAINVGQDHLRGDGWLLHIDADIVLCKDFRRMLEMAQLDTANIYGADRINVYGYEAWQKLKPLLASHYQDRWFIDPGFCHQPTTPQGVRWGARVIHKEYGWVPIGFFQLWYGATARRYNFKRGSAAGTDVMFPVQWPRKNRVLLPDVVVYHLDSEQIHGIGTNWKGRKSRPFAPAAPANTAAKSFAATPGPADVAAPADLVGRRHDLPHPHPGRRCQQPNHCRWPDCHCHQDYDA